MHQKESLPFYHTARWKRVRAMCLQRDQGMCQDCMRKFRDGKMEHPNRATMVHHIIEYRDRPDLALSLDNLVSLCDSCHDRRHPDRGRGGRPEEKQVGMRVIRV